MLTLLVATLCAGCRKVPDYVIAPDEMARLMADIHIAETVVENNYSDYPSDSARMLLKQSVLAKHGYSKQQLDTSFMWYGANLTVYSDVFDKEITILEDRLAQSGAVATTRHIAADSVDMWDRSRFIIVRPTSPNRILSFGAAADGAVAWKKGDIFTLRGKFSNTVGNTTVVMTVDYDDDSFETLTNRFAGDGWHEVNFYADSVKMPQALRGTLRFGDVTNNGIVVDSIQLIRKSIDPALYSQRYRQRAYDLKDKVRKQSQPALTDTTHRREDI